MVITRAQSTNNNQASPTNTDEYSDNGSDNSLPGFSSQNFNGWNDNQQITDCEGDHERAQIEQRFKDMNRHIRELTTLARTLIGKIASSNRGQRMAPTIFMVWELQVIVTGSNANT